eukprot:c43821_g1_i1 orf=599-1102(+)
MTIQLHVGLQPVQALPKDASWVAGLPENNVTNLAELNEFNSLKLQYISLRDLMVVSPTKRGVLKVKEVEWCDPSQVKFKDELLKQAARAYLQPTGKITVPKAHFFEKCWKSFTAQNKSLVACAKEYVRIGAAACVNFLKAQGLGLIRRFKPQTLGFRRVRPQGATSV